MSHSHFQTFLNLPGNSMPPPVRLIGYLLAHHHNRESGRCDPSVSRLSEESGLAGRSVIRAIQKLESLGFVSVIRATGTRSKYLLNLDMSTTGTSDTESPVTVSQGCHTDTPTSDSVSGDPCHRVTGPVTGCHPKRKEKELKKNLNGKGAHSDLGKDEDSEPLLAGTPPKSTRSKAKAESPEAAEEFGLSIGCDSGQGEAFYWKMEGNGWTSGGSAVKDWKATFRSWQMRGFLPRLDPQHRNRSARPASESDSLEDDNTPAPTAEDSIRSMGGDDEAVERHRALMAKFNQPAA